MGFKIREIEPERKFCEELSLEAFTRVIPLSEMHAVLEQLQVRERRHRKLTLLATLLLVIALHLYSQLSISGVFARLGRGLRFIWPEDDLRLPRASALSYRRAQLGARPLVALFHRVCQPLATPATDGAFVFGRRLVALDGTVEAVPDTPENARAFGRARNAQGESAFPQVRGVYLVECGTHAVLDAGFWPYRTSEEVGAWRLLRSVRAGDLLLVDAGLHSFALLERAGAQGAKVIARLPATVKPQVLEVLPDGSVLAELRPSEAARRRRGDRLRVRLITYQITDPARAGYGETHRLVTTLLDEQEAPALEVVAVYAERIEIELVIDELDTHQRLLERPLRSLKPVGVIQELYGLLIAHYALRALMHEAAVAAGVAPTRLSFVGALRLVQDAIPEFQMVIPAQRPALYHRLLQDLAAERLPERRPRANPRVVKRQQSKFPRKRAEHYRALPLAIPFQTVVRLI